MIKRILDKILNRLYVVLDDTDNSVTLSPHLAEIVMADIVNENKIHMFSDGREYGFCVNHPDLVGKDTPFAPLQKNFQHNTIGFNATCPSVNRIYYDYGLECGKAVRKRVERCRCKDFYYFKICRQ